jgi:23S rRNA (uracil1939-C5)-methyltransferase
MENNKQRRIVDVAINEYSKKGNGIGTALLPNGSEISVEVPFAIPGDTVSALLLKKRKGLYQSLLETVAVPSPDRIAPRCVHFGRCGGCRWQQISYEQQLALKESAVRKYFAHSLTHLVDVRPIFPCTPPWEYRNKMEFSFSTNKAGERFLGLIMDSSRGKVFHLYECHLVNPWFAEAVAAVRSWWGTTDLDAYHPMSNRGSLRTLTVREGQRTGDRMVMLTVSGNPDFSMKKHQIASFIEAVREAIEPALPGKLSLFLRIHQAVKGIPTNFYEMHLYGEDHIRETLHVSLAADEPPIELTFKISASAFFQPNSRQA